jgi:integrase
VHALSNPVHRPAHALQLFTGLRVSDLVSIEWKSVHWKEGSLHLPTPKGGKAFYVPLSREAMACLRWARVVGMRQHPAQAARWVFPKASAVTGHVDRHDIAKDDLSHTSHDLRRTFGQLGEDALRYSPDNGRQVLARFYNHGSRTITDRYLIRTAEGRGLLEDMQIIDTAIRAALRPANSQKK